MFGDHRCTAPNFLQELADDVTLSSSLLGERISGRKDVREFISSFISQLHWVESQFQVTSGGKDFFVYRARLENGKTFEGTVVLSRNAKGEVSNAMMGHSPFQAVQALVDTMSTDQAIRSGAKGSWVSKVLSFAEWISR